MTSQHLVSLARSIFFLITLGITVKCFATTWPSFRPPYGVHGPGCGWQWEFLGTNPLAPFYPETHANYWVYAWDREPGQADSDLRIVAAVPETRFWSYTLYDGETGAVIDTLHDQQVLAHGTEQTPSTQYTLEVRQRTQQDQMVTQPHLTIPADLRYPVLMLRYYVDDPSQSYGGKSLPTIHAVEAGSDRLTECPKPAVFRLPDDTLAVARKFRQMSRSVRNAQIDFYRIDAQGLYPNPANAYLSTRLFFGDYGDLAIIGFKSVPASSIGWKGVLRYQSLCMGSFLTTLTPANGCLMDREYRQESDGTLQFVISSDQAVLDHAKRIGLNALQAGTGFPMVLIRQLLALADHPYAFLQVPTFDPTQAHAPQSARFLLGDYGPQGYYCQREDFLRMGLACR